jgi:flagellar hook-associated protein 1 FlgK
MGSLTGLFDLTRQALQANQAALNATANNVANQNTAGYTREVASFSSGDTVTLSANVQSNSGPQVTTTSARDRILEARVQQQTQAQAGTSARGDVLTQIQNVFSIGSSGSSTGETQLGTALDSFFSSLTALAGNPTDSATQQGVLSAAQTVASEFNSAASQLQAVNAGINSNVANTVTAVNGLTATIAGLNKQIGELDPNADAGQLEDQRQLAIEQLSQYVGLDQIRTENNGITLTTQGGAALVVGATAATLTAASSAGTTQILANGTDVTAGVEGGSIGGQLTAQSVDLPSVTSALDSLAYRVATAVNTQNEAGLTATGAAGTAIFSVPATASGAAAAISVIPTDAGAIASAATGEGSSGSGNANALADLGTATDSSGQTISGALGTMLAEVGTQASALSEQNTAEQATLTQLTTQRDSQSAVSLDTESANLSQYQKSYKAAAQVLTVIDQLMASAINLGVRTSVS